MSTTQPSPRTWTLRFKNNRTTILLHVDPLQKLSSVKSDLLKAIQQTHPHGRLSGAAIPQNSAEIQLAKPRDAEDLAEGFQSIEPRREMFADGSDSGKGKGKASAGKQKQADTSRECPESVGLRDGGIVAFRFRGEGGRPGGRGQIVDDEIDDIRVSDEDDDRDWDVIVPDIDEGEEEGLPSIERMDEDQG